MNDTKSKIINTLVIELENKPLNKITIKDITQKTNISRRLFYYYFDDLYSVIEFVFSTKTKQILEDNSDIRNWKYGYIIMLNWILKSKRWIKNLYNSIEKEYIDNFMYNTLYFYIKNVVENESKDIKVTEEQKDFIAKYFTLSFNAIGLDWMKRGMKENPEDVVKQIAILVDGDFKKALKKFDKENTK